MELNLRAFIGKIKEKKSQKKKIKSTDRKRGSDQKKKQIVRDMKTI